MTKPVRTHTFKLGKYHIFEGFIAGWCDMPDETKLEMGISPDSDQEALAITIHEAMHAEGIPLHIVDADRDPSKEIARFLWRLGWRKQDQ